MVIINCLFGNLQTILKRLRIKKLQKKVSFSSKNNLLKSDINNKDLIIEKRCGITKQRFNY